MTIDEAISHALEVADSNNLLADKFDEWDEWEKADADNCRKCAADHRQLAEWLTELKELREENKVLISECDRLIKEKGELLSKVSGGDVLRICQLEEQLQVKLDNSHCLEIELKEAKRLLKAAVDDNKRVLRENFGDICQFCKHYSNSEAQCRKPHNGSGSWCCENAEWRYTNEALKLIGGSENG